MPSSTNRDILRSQLQILLFCYCFSQKNSVIRTLCSLKITYATTSHRNLINCHFLNQTFTIIISVRLPKSREEYIWWMWTVNFQREDRKVKQIHAINIYIYTSSTLGTEFSLISHSNQTPHQPKISEESEKQQAYPKKANISSVPLTKTFIFHKDWSGRMN